MACHLARSITNHRDMIWWLWVKVRIPNRTAKLIVGCAYHDEHLWATGSTIFPIKWSGWFAPTRWRPVELFNKRRSQTLWWIFLAFMDDLSLLYTFVDFFVKPPNRQFRWEFHQIFFLGNPVCRQKGRKCFTVFFSNVDLCTHVLKTCVFSPCSGKEQCKNTRIFQVCTKKPTKR